MNNKIDLVDVLGWGYLDVEFLNDRINEFNIDIDDIKDDIDGYADNYMEINSWIYSTFRIAAYNFLDKVEDYANSNNIEFNKDDIEIEVFCNYLDSFLNGDKLNSEIAMKILFSIKLVSSIEQRPRIEEALEIIYSLTDEEITFWCWKVLSIKNKALNGFKSMYL